MVHISVCEKCYVWFCTNCFSSKGNSSASGWSLLLDADVLSAKKLTFSGHWWNAFGKIRSICSWLVRQMEPTEWKSVFVPIVPLKHCLPAAAFVRKGDLQKAYWVSGGARGWVQMPALRCWINHNTESGWSHPNNLLYCLSRHDRSQITVFRAEENWALQFNAILWMCPWSSEGTGWCDLDL